MSVRLPAGLLGDVRSLIEQARSDVARSVNSALVMLYWQVGKRIRDDVLKKKRAAYGEEIVSALGTQLTAEYGRGYSRRNLSRMMRFAEVFPDLEIVSAPRTQLGWSQFKEIIALDGPLKRDFYAEMCRLENWSTHTALTDASFFTGARPLSFPVAAGSPLFDGRDTLVMTTQGFRRKHCLSVDEADNPQEAGV